LQTDYPVYRTRHDHHDRMQKFIAASASIPAIVAVEPVTSANRTVARLRSPGTSAMRAASGFRGSPHQAQNRAVSGKSRPQWAHTGAKEAPFGEQTRHRKNLAVM